MKKIFEEREQIGSYEKAWVSSRQIDYNRDRVLRMNIEFHGAIVAYYDQETSALVIDLTAGTNQEYDESWLPAPKRIYETQGTKARALRSAISHADAWYEHIDQLSPEPARDDALLTDEQVIARDREMSNA